MLDWQYERDSKKTLSNDINEVKQSQDYIMDHMHILTNEVKKLKISINKIIDRYEHGQTNKQDKKGPR